MAVYNNCELLVWTSVWANNEKKTASSTQNKKIISHILYYNSALLQRVIATTRVWMLKCFIAFLESLKTKSDVSQEGLWA